MDGNDLGEEGAAGYVRAILVTNCRKAVSRSL